MHFDRDGIAFDYPDNWTVETSGNPGNGLEVTVSAPDGAFWSINCQPAGSEPNQLTEAVISEMRQEYPNLDSEPVIEDVFGRALPGADLNFYCLDLTNTAEIRCLETPTACYVLFCQAEDRDWEQLRHVFKAMNTSFVRAADNGPA
jgi:hypothetical protein